MVIFQGVLPGLADFLGKIACGHIHKELKLTDWTYLCPVCGHAMDRDKRAVRNILNEAKRMTGAA